MDVLFCFVGGEFGKFEEFDFALINIPVVLQRENDESVCLWFL